jgi:small-conductance mechanosensitive channel
MIDHRYAVLAASRWLGLFLCLYLAASAAWAAVEGPRSLSLQVKEWQKTLDDAEKELAKPDIPDTSLSEWRNRLADLGVAARSAVAASQPLIRTIGGDLDALGPPPAEGSLPEAPNLVVRRKELNQQLATAEGAAKEAGLVIARADRVLAAVKRLRLARFTEHVFTPSESPLSPDIWGKALPELWGALAALYAAAQQNWPEDGLAGLLGRIGWRLALGVGLALLLAFPLRSWLIRRFGYVAVRDRPSVAQRLWTAVFTGVVRALLPSAAALAVYFGLLYSGLLSDPVAGLVRVALVLLVFSFFVIGVSRSALAPFEPEWRLVHIHDEGALALSRSITVLAVVFALDLLLRHLCAEFDASVELVAAQKFVFGMLISLALFSLLRRRVWHSGDSPETKPFWRRPRYWLALPVAAIPLSALLGYVVLSRLLATQWVLTVGWYAAVVLLRGIASEAADYALSADSALGRKLRAALSLSDDGAEMLAFWVGGCARLLVLVLGLLLLLPLWGFAGKDLNAWLSSALLGFKLGSVTVSLTDAGLALLAFAGLLVATRMLQSFLERRIFPRTRLDLGVRDSLRSGVGYVGYALALIFAVSILGLDLSSLAIIAGALSVGIGFGLQNIVNNFVSGLILLVERPIKAGDWVVVGEHQGYVKRISVRATEIATFDRASVFIPNSNLISGTVMNRTYADKIGRVQLPIGVAYGADPKQARDVLLDIARSHPDIRQHPAPCVYFQGFGDSALNLELVAFLQDVDKARTVNSDLCFAIHAAFQREGIEIPFPQRDIKVTLDEGQLRRALDR